jgi:hypothetical protein
VLRHVTIKNRSHNPRNDERQCVDQKDGWYNDENVIVYRILVEHIGSTKVNFDKQVEEFKKQLNLNIMLMHVPHLNHRILMHVNKNMIEIDDK